MLKTRSYSKRRFSDSVLRDGFTLVELITTVGVIGILIGIAFPAMQTVRQMARKTHCINNIRQLAMASLAYESSGTGLPVADKKGMSFVVALLPHFDETTVWDRAKSALSSGETMAERLMELSNEQIEVLNCPAAVATQELATIVDHGTYTNHYFGITGPIGSATNSSGSDSYFYKELSPQPTKGRVGLQGVFAPSNNGRFSSRELTDIKDGLSNTFIFGENSNETIFDLPAPVSERYRSGWAFGAAYNSNNLTHTFAVKSVRLGINAPYSSLNDLPFGSNHPGGTHFACVDGSTHFVNQEIDVSVLKTYSSINQKEDVEGFDNY